MRKKGIERRGNKISICIVLIIFFIFIGVTNMNAAGFLGIGNTASWKEEVLLHDGSKIIAERWQKHGGRHEPGIAPDISDQSISFTIPGINKNVKWKDEASAELGGRANFLLIALHIFNDTPYIITEPRLCLSYNKWGRPNPPYVIFKYENKDWKRIEITDLPMEFKNMNLVIETQGYNEEKLVNQGIASAEMVKKLNSSLKQEQYKTIARTPLKGVGCMELVPDGNGGWLGTGWFKSQPSYEECLKYCKRNNIKAEYCLCDKYFKSNIKGE